MAIKVRTSRNDLNHDGGQNGSDEEAMRCGILDVVSWRVRRDVGS